MWYYRIVLQGLILSEARVKRGLVPPVSASAFSPLHDFLILDHLTEHPIASGNQFIWNFHLQAERDWWIIARKKKSQSYLILILFTLRTNINAMQLPWTKCQDETHSYAWKWFESIVRYCNTVFYKWITIK